MDIKAKSLVHFEWRCPFGDMCGRHQNVLFKKDTRNGVLMLGTWHLFNTEHHPDPTFTWEEAIAGIQQGVSKTTMDNYIIVEEEEMNRQEKVGREVK